MGDIDISTYSFITCLNCVSYNFIQRNQNLQQTGLHKYIFRQVTYYKFDFRSNILLYLQFNLNILKAPQLNIPGSAHIYRFPLKRKMKKIQLPTIFIAKVPLINSQPFENNVKNSTFILFNHPNIQSHSYDKLRRSKLLLEHTQISLEQT